MKISTFLILFVNVCLVVNAQTTTQFVINGDFEDSLTCSFEHFGGYIYNNCNDNVFNDCRNPPVSAYSGNGFFSIDLIDHRDSLLFYNITTNYLGPSSFNSLNNGFPHVFNLDLPAIKEIIVKSPLSLYLKQPTVPNCDYAVKFFMHPYISDSVFCYSLFNDSTSIHLESYMRNYYIKNIGGAFANNPLNGLSFKTTDTLNNINYGYDLSPQYYGPIEPSDTIVHIKGNNTGFYNLNNWYPITDTFTSTNSFSIFQIGNFDLFSDLDLLYQQNVSDSILNSSLDTFHISNSIIVPIYLDHFIRARYYFDNISILPIGFEDLTLDLGTDTSLCNGAININAYEPRFEHYLWNTGDTTPSINITQGGTYILEADYGCGKLIDSIVVAENPPDSLVNIPDTLFLCPNEMPFTLTANQNYNNLYWSTGDTAQNISIVSEGLYTAYLEYYCLTVTDPTYIFIKQNHSDLISFTDTTVCNSFSYSLVDTFSNYTWSNGSTSHIFTATQSGTYWLQAETNCFTYTDTFSVTIENLEIGSGIRTLDKCPDDFPLNLQAQFAAPTYFWNTGENTQNITVLDIKKDTFSVSYTNVCGLAENTFYINVLPDYLEEPITILKDSCTEKNYYVVSVQNTDSLATYMWNNETTGFSYLGENESVLLYAFSACQSYEQSIELPQCPEQIKFALPTAFSPNLDGVNDGFGLLYLNGNYKLEHLEVYNRWGEKIFFTEDKNSFWDGKYKNEKQDIGNYIYKLKLQGIDEIYSGSLFLMR